MEMTKFDPFAKPQKVADAEAQAMLGEVLAAIRNLSGGFTTMEAAFVDHLQRLIDRIPQEQKLDLSPLLMVLERLERKEIPTTDLSAVVELLERPQPLVEQPDWDAIIDRLLAASNSQSLIATGGSDRVRNINKELINPATEETLLALLAELGGGGGDWAYEAGVDGTSSLPAGSIVTGISATSGASAATVTIDGGDTITIPAYGSMKIAPGGTLEQPAVVFTDTTSYLIGYYTA